MVVMAALVAGCGASVNPAGTGTGSTGGGFDPTTSSSSSTDAATAGETSTEPGSFRFDVQPERLDLSGEAEGFRACSDAPAVLDVRMATTPDGPSEIVDAFASYDVCSNAVYISLVPAQPSQYELIMLIDASDVDAWPAPVYMGALDTVEGGLGAPGGSAAVTFVEPWDSSEGFDADANPVLELQLELHVEGWDISADVSVPFCADRAACFCPCE